MAESNTDVNTEVEEKLAAAAAAESSTTETVETSTTEEVTETEEKGSKEENRVPQKRFNEVNSALKEAREAQEASVTQLAESNEKLVRMAELLESKDDDVQTLNEIKSYINDPDMADHVKAIDAKLRGIDAEVETGETTPDEALAKTNALLAQTREEVADAQATVQAEQLVTKADIIAEKLLAQLPEEYNEQDRNTITSLWTNGMDWDEAVADPDNLAELLTKDFQTVIDEYGVPRGSLVTTEEAEENETETAQTPEQELEAAMGLDWGATKTVEKSGRTTVEADLSDDAFNALQAKIIRTIHGR